jgi:hypothetical protein
MAHKVRVISLLPRLWLWRVVVFFSTDLFGVVGMSSAKTLAILPGVLIGLLQFNVLSETASGRENLTLGVFKSGKHGACQGGGVLTKASSMMGNTKALESEPLKGKSKLALASAFWHTSVLSMHWRELGTDLETLHFFVLSSLPPPLPLPPSPSSLLKREGEGREGRGEGVLSICLRQ